MNKSLDTPYSPVVSILVLVDVFLQFREEGRICLVPFVSILVLVDVFLQYQDSFKGGVQCGGFNPCFSGCLSPVVLAWSNWSISPCFNPCFSGCLSPVKLNGRMDHLKKGGFNPCFSGCLSPVLNPPFLNFYIPQFQSLF